MDSLLPFFWINKDFNAAVELYSTLFGGGVTELDDDPESPELPMTRTIRIGDSDVIVFNGEPHMQMTGGGLISLMVLCESQAEVDRYWDGLSKDGEPSQCGWVTDRFGVTWQIVPRLFRDLTTTGDEAARQRLFEAMMKMTKFDCAALQAAYDAS